MTAQGTDDPGQLDRERRDADARYNKALTAFDDVIVATSGRELSREDFDRAASALLQFLQQITAFVENKDRQLAFDARARLDMLAQALEPIAELRTQVGVLQRAIEMLKRTVTSHLSSVVSPQSSVVSPQSTVVSPQSTVSPQPSRLRSLADPASSGEARRHADVATAAVPTPDDDYKYVGFEDQFRGSDAAIEERLRTYVPIFAGCTDVLDIGCGRGEMLTALGTAGVRARGIDINGAMVATACERGLDATHADALEYLSALPDGSLGGMIATQVIEHLEPAYLMRLLDAAARTLRPGAPIVLETINPTCWLGFFSSYIRDLTHVRPIHPDTLQYLLRASAFERVTICYSAPVPEQVKMKTVDMPAAVLASEEPSLKALARIGHVLNTNAIILNNLMFTHLDYAAIGYRT
jgi:SAM-dependent methyltransferase